jgi:ketosteroid isomerase-like protein
MSQENVEIATRALKAYNDRDFEAMLDIYDPDVEVSTLVLGTFRGPDGIRRIAEENADTMPGNRFDPIDVIDAGDKVVAELSVGGAGRASQIAPTNQSIAVVLTFQKGLIARQEVFRTRAEALAAVGLAE